MAAPVAGRINAPFSRRGTLLPHRRVTKDMVVVMIQGMIVCKKNTTIWSFHVLSLPHTSRVSMEGSRATPLGLYKTNLFY